MIEGMLETPLTECLHSRQKIARKGKPWGRTWENIELTRRAHLLCAYEPRVSYASPTPQHRDVVHA